MDIVCFILNYNDSLRTSKLAKKIVSFNSIGKIVILDNNSIDKNILSTEINDKKIDIIFSKENLMYAGGTQKGLEYIFDNYNAKYILIINSDVDFEENTLKYCYDFMKKENCGLCSPTMLNINGEIDSDCYWNEKKYFDLIKFCFFLGRRKKQKYNIKNSSQKVDCIRGSFQLFSANALKAIDGYDTNIKLYYEEDIIGRKLKLNGYSSFIFKDVFYKHNHNHLKKYRTNIFKICLNDMYYYWENYFKTNIFLKFFLKLCIHLGIFEHKIMDCFLWLFELKKG